MAQTEPLTAERTWTVEDIPVLTAAVTLPPPPEDAGPKTARRTQGYYQGQCRAFLKHCERFLLPQAQAAYRAALAASAPLPCFHAELTYRVTYRENGLWSLYTQSREVTGSGRPRLTRWGDTWDLRTGWLVPPAAFFPPHWKREVLALAIKDIQRREAAGAARYREDWQRQLRRHFNAQNFYLTEDGLAFFYPPGTLAPISEGVTVFTVPWGTPPGEGKEEGGRLPFTPLWA